MVGSIFCEFLYNPFVLYDDYACKITGDVVGRQERGASNTVDSVFLKSTGSCTFSAFNVTLLYYIDRYFPLTNEVVKQTLR